MRFPRSSRFAVLVRFLLTVTSVLGAIRIPATGPASAAEVAAPGFHFLAADASLRTQTENTSVIMGQATFVGKVLQLDQTWEAPYAINDPGSVVVDPVTGQWRMYYELAPWGDTATNWVMAMATSNDGVTWTKPAWDVTGTTYTTDHSNNIIQGAETYMRGPSVFVDPTAPADQRYRMVEVPSRTGMYHTMYADASADGLHWRHMGVISANQLDLDSQNTAFWDPRTKQYIACMREWFPADGTSPMRRGVAIKRSDTFGADWTGPLEHAIDPKNVATIGPGFRKPDIYCSSAVPYYGQYIGIPSMFYHADDNPFGAGAVYPSFMYSRDSANWTFEDPDHPIIDLAAHGQTAQTFSQAYAMSTLPARNGDLYIYYAYSPGHHNTPFPDNILGSAIYLAKLREDRFVGIKSDPGSIGIWTTCAITLPSDPGDLIVNAVVGGSLRVEVLDSLTGRAIPGYSAADGLAIGTGDFLNAAAGWQGIGDLDALAGRTVALRFVMDNATVYGFRFESVPEPSAFVLCAMGLLSVLVYAWRKRTLRRSRSFIDP